MTNPQSHALIEFRIRQAHSSLLAAEKLAEYKLWRDSCNSAYYAMYYAILAILVDVVPGTPDHSEAMRLFDTEFIAADKLSGDLSDILHRCYAQRMDCDYGEMVQLGQFNATEMLERSRLFVSKIKGYLKIRDTIEK